jgi:membrane-bound lytic murein transglycosylase D
MNIPCNTAIKKYLVIILSLLFLVQNYIKLKRHNMALTKITTGAAILLLVLVGINEQVFSWGLFNLFTDTAYPEEAQKRIEDFDPNTDVLYLPDLKDKDVFQATRDLSICRKKSVRKFVYHYLTGGREYLVRSIGRSYLYEDILKEVFKNNKDMPEELSMLPLLESCFDPNAVSSSRAVGLWQFVDNTARPLGLERNRWVDERRNIEKSTEAALRHLRNLRVLFPSWELTLAAYNGGAGYVKRTMDRTGTRDFWTLAENGALRGETSEYVPRFIALLLIYKNQRLFGIKDEINIPEKRETERFTLEKAVDLRHVSRVSGVPLQTLKELNPELILSITPPSRKTYGLRIPSDAKKMLEIKTKELYRDAVAGVREYRVKKGDTVGKIARADKKKIGLIIKLNRIKNPDILQPGQIIYVPI